MSDAEEDEGAEGDGGDGGRARAHAPPPGRPSRGTLAGDLEEAGHRVLLPRERLPHAPGVRRRRARGSRRGTARGRRAAGRCARRPAVRTRYRSAGGRRSAGRAPHTGVTMICFSGATRAAASAGGPAAGPSRTMRRSTSTRAGQRPRAACARRRAQRRRPRSRRASRRPARRTAARPRRGPRRPQVEIARDAHQLGGGEAVPAPLPAVGDVGLDRAEVAPAVEDDGERVAEGEPRHPERDRGRGLGVDQGPAE